MAAYCNSTTLTNSYKRALNIIAIKPSGKRLVLDATEKDTVGDLKLSIQKIEGVPVDQQILLLGRRRLEDKRTLKVGYREESDFI